MSSWQDIGDIFTTEGLKKLKIGQVLTFNYEGSLQNFKIMRMGGKKVWVRPINLTRGEDLVGHMECDLDTTKEAIAKYGAPYCPEHNQVIGK